MIHNVYSVHDAVAKAWLVPFYARSDAEAQRMMVNTCTDPNSMFNKHPDDFRMYRLGLFNDEKGQLLPHDIPDLICSARDCMPGPLFDNVPESRPASVRPLLVGE